MPKYNFNFKDRIKSSLRGKLVKEIDQYQTFDQEYKISSHPIKKIFLAISKLNSIHKGIIEITEISKETKLSNEDIVFVIQEFIDQRLIEGYIKESQTSMNETKEQLVLKQDYYFCQIDQMEHSSFEIRMQCSQCLRFVCMLCYRSINSEICPFCHGDMIPVPRIFKKTDIQYASFKTSEMKESFTDYYNTKISNISHQGILKASSKVIDDIKEISKRWSLSNLKEKTQDYLIYRKYEDSISKNEKLVLDTISIIYELEEINEISLLRLAKITKLEFVLVFDIISRLIANQSINGFIDTGETFNSNNDNKLILNSNDLQCEITGQQFPINSAHYQCGKCFRAFSSIAFEAVKEQGMVNCLFCGGKVTFFPGEKK